MREMMNMTSAYRQLPSVERIISDERLAPLIKAYSRQAILDITRHELAQARSAIAADGSPRAVDEIISSIEAQAELLGRGWPRHVINATGVVLHTNLGRAPLSEDAIAAMIRPLRVIATWNSILTRVGAGRDRRTSQTLLRG